MKKIVNGTRAHNTTFLFQINTQLHGFNYWQISSWVKWNRAQTGTCADNNDAQGHKRLYSNFVSFKVHHFSVYLGVCSRAACVSANQNVPWPPLQKSLSISSELPVCVRYIMFPRLTFCSDSYTPRGKFTVLNSLDVFTWHWFSGVGCFHASGDCQVVCQRLARASKLWFIVNTKYLTVK